MRPLYEKETISLLGHRIVFFSIIILFIYGQTFGAPVVGTIHGAEWEYLSIGEECYEITYDAPVNRTDKGSFVGIVTSGETKFRVYSMKGNDDYLYCQWEWEGHIYKRTQ